MPVWHFICIPKLPQEIAHQSNLVQLIEYRATEGQQVQPGTPIAIVQNYWAIIQIETQCKGYLERTIFKPGMSISIGDPIAIVEQDGEDAGIGEEHQSISIMQVLKQKPSK